MRQPEQHIHKLLEPVITSMGYELWGIEHTGHGGILRIYIDIDTEEGITVEDCSLVSEQVSAVLDVEDVIKGKYNLEVSSPGLYRPLFTAAHFQRFSGEPIKLTMGMAFEGRRKFAGEIIECTDKILSLHGTDGESWELPLNDVANAHLNPKISFSKR